MEIDVALVVAAIAALGGLLLEILRRFAKGDLLSRNVVPREDYDRIVSINESYAAKFGEQTTAITTLAAALDGFAPKARTGSNRR